MLFSAYGASILFLNLILQSFSVLFGLTRSYMPMVHPYFHAWSASSSQEGAPKDEQVDMCV